MRSGMRVLGLMLFVAAAVSAVPAAWAEEGKLFDFQQIELDNGLDVVTLEDFSCPIVTVQVWYHVGSKDEDPNRQGFAHMFEHMMFRGTDHLGPKDHFELIRKTGGTNNADTSFDRTRYYQTLPANQLDLALWLEAERMAFLAVNQENFDTERQVVEEELRMYRNQPYGTLADQMLNELFKVHPYRWLVSGRISHLRAAHVQELRDFWMKYYLPNNATLIIVGAVKHEDAQAKAREYFGWISRGPEPPRVTAREPMPTAPREIEIKEDNAPTPLVGLLYHGVPASHPDAIALNLLTTILGGGESSRLYRDLVAESQTAAIAMAGAFSLEQAGIVAAGAALPPLGGESADAVQSTIAEHVDRVRNELVSERELTKAKNQMLKGVILPQLTVESKAMALGNTVIDYGDAAAVNEQLDRIRAVTREDLQRVAREYLAPDRVLRASVPRAGMMGLGSLFGGGGKSPYQQEGRVTAEPEEEAPPPGRPGVVRPDSYPATPPVADARLDFDSSINRVEHKLPNGLKIMVVENHEVPYVTAMLGSLNGAWTEEKPGTASMALSMLTKGTEAHDEATLAEELETYAISLSGNAGMDTASIELGCLTEQIERGVDFMAEIVLTPTFPEEEFKKLVNQARTGMTIQETQPEYMADRELRRLLWGDHPYSRTPEGELKDLDHLRVSDLRNWWEANARPEDSVLIFSGDIAPKHAIALAEKAFSSWVAKAPKPELTLAPFPQQEARHIYLVDRPGKQAQIRVAQLGITRNHPHYFVSRVVNGYFGGSFGSRLMDSLRVEKGLTYGVGGGYRAYRFGGRFIVSTFSKNQSTAEAVQAIFDEIERLRAEQPTEDEIGTFRSYALGSFAAERETPQQVAGNLWLLEYAGLSDDYFQRLLDGISATSAEDCLELAKATLDPDKMIVVVVGSAKKLEEDLAKIAPVTVIKPGEEKPKEVARAGN